MTGMRSYYISRVLISIGFGFLLWFTGTPLWMAALIGALALLGFIWAPHSGRYAVYPELGVTALRRDERTQAINDKAARNAFVVLMLSVGGIAVYFGLVGATMIPLGILDALLILGGVTYFGFDFWLRRS